MWILAKICSVIVNLNKTYEKFKCHCGRIEAEININSLDKILRCNCSICKRKGAIMAMVNNEDFKIIKGKEFLKLYQFHSKVAKHYLPICVLTFSP